MVTVYKMISIIYLIIFFISFIPSIILFIIHSNKQKKHNESVIDLLKTINLVKGMSNEDKKKYLDN